MHYTLFLFPHFLYSIMTVLPFDNWRKSPIIASRDKILGIDNENIINPYSGMPNMHPESAVGSLYNDTNLTLTRLAKEHRPGLFSEAAVDNLVSLEEVENAGIKLEASRRVAEAAAKIAQNEAEKVNFFSKMVVPNL